MSNESIPLHVEEDESVQLQVEDLRVIRAVSPSVQVEAISDGHRVTITDLDGTQTFDVLDGVPGDPGRGIATITKTGTSGLTDIYTITYTDGTTQTYFVVNGANGFSPSISVSAITGGHRITVTDADGTRTFDVMDGEDGRGIVSIAKTATSGLVDTYTITYTDNTTSTFTVINGKDGYSPTIAVAEITGGHRVTVTNKSGSSYFDVLDGQPGQPGPGVPAGGTTGQVPKKKSDADYDLEWGDEPSVPVKDVQVNNTSIVDAQGVANVPIAVVNSGEYGLVKVGSNGVGIDTTGTLRTIPAGDSSVKSGTVNYNPIVPLRQHMSTFYGLAKCAGADMASSSNAVGTYTDEAKVAIQKMLGVYREWEKIVEVTTTEDLASLEITTDENGQSFELSEMYVRAQLPPPTTGTQDYVSAAILMKKINGGTGSSSAPTLRYNNGTSKLSPVYRAEIVCGILECRGRQGTTFNSTQTLQGISSSPNNSDFASIYGFRMGQYSTTQTLLPSGSKITIYGKRK